MNKIKKRVKEWFKVKKTNVLTIKHIKEVLKHNALYIVFIFVALLDSALLRIVTIGSLFSIKAIISDLAFIFTIGSINFLIKPKTRFRVLFLFLQRGH